MAKYVHKRSVVDALIFYPAPEPGAGQERKPEMPGVERVPCYDGAGGLRAITYMVGRVPYRTGVVAGKSVIAIDETGEARAYDSKEAFEKDYVADSDEAAKEFVIAPPVLATAMTAADTAAMLNSTAIFGDAKTGVVKIDAEIIQYNDLNATALLGLQRGVRGTVAATHRVGSQILPGEDVKKEEDLPPPPPVPPKGQPVQ